MTDTVTAEGPTTTEVATKKLKKMVTVENPQAPVLNATTGKLELRLATSNKIPLSLNLPEPLSEALKADALSRSLSENAIAREIVASHYNMLILDNNLSRIGKLSGFTKEQKAAMRKEKAQVENAKVKKILEALSSGKITPELAAQLGLV